MTEERDEDKPETPGERYRREYLELKEKHEERRRRHIRMRKLFLQNNLK